MTPAARLQAAIDILEGLDASALPADRFIRDWFRTRRYAGSKDRAAIAARVFDVYRHRATYAFRMQSEVPRALVLASAAAEDSDIDALFAGNGYGPAPLSREERALLSAAAPEAPLAVRCEFPAFLESELHRGLGEALEGEMQAMLTRAPVDLRANTLKMSREALVKHLTQEGYAVAPTPHSPLGLRIAAQEGLATLRQSKDFEAGLFEFQDEAAQIAALLADARPDMRVLDLAAGAGGKALALAAEMDNRGAIVAHDIDAGRLRQIGPRAARAGVTIIETTDRLPDGAFDIVFLDAPCSGSGTWRRQPEQKWRLTPARLGDLCAVQDELLEKGAARVRPGGRLVYATCSLLPSENEDRIADFLARHPGFALLPAASCLPAPVPGLGEVFRATPATTGTDGFFAAILVNKEEPCTN